MLIALFLMLMMMTTPTLIQVFSGRERLFVFPVYYDVIETRQGHLNVTVWFRSSVHNGSRTQRPAGSCHVPGMDASLLLRAADST